MPAQGQVGSYHPPPLAKAESPVGEIFKNFFLGPFHRNFYLIQLIWIHISVILIELTYTSIKVKSLLMSCIMYAHIYPS